MAGRYPIRQDQGATLSRSFRVTSKRGEVVDVANTVNPLVRVDRPHGLSVGNEVCVARVQGSTGVNNTPLTPVWVVATVPSSTTFTVATDAPGEFLDTLVKGIVSVPRSIVGYSARMQVRPAAESTVILLEASTAGGGIVIAAPTGSAVVHQVRVTASAAATAALAADTYRYDVEIESPGGVVERISEGPFSIRVEVTR